MFGELTLVGDYGVDSQRGLDFSGLLPPHRELNSLSFFRRIRFWRQQPGTQRDRSHLRLEAASAVFGLDSDTLPDVSACSRARFQRNQQLRFRRFRNILKRSISAVEDHDGCGLQLLPDWREADHFAGTAMPGSPKAYLVVDLRKNIYFAVAQYCHVGKPAESGSSDRDISLPEGRLLPQSPKTTWFRGSSRRARGLASRKIRWFEHERSLSSRVRRESLGEVATTDAHARRHRRRRRRVSDPPRLASIR